MAYAPLEDLLKNSDSIYKLVIMASKRALELSEGRPKLVESSSDKSATVALEEIAQGKVTYKIKKSKEE